MTETLLYWQQSLPFLRMNCPPGWSGVSVFKLHDKLLQLLVMLIICELCLFSAHLATPEIDLENYVLFIFSHRNICNDKTNAIHPI